MLTIRPEAPDDLPFIRKLYVGWKCESLGLAAMPEPMRENLLDLQWRSYLAGQKVGSAEAVRSVLVFEGAATGWIAVDRSGRTIHLAEIHVASQWRGRGLGGSLIARLQAEGAKDGRPVTLQVHPFNPARQLYHRLGFVERPLKAASEEDLIVTAQIGIDLIWHPANGPGQLRQE